MNNNQPQQIIAEDIFSITSANQELTKDMLAVVNTLSVYAQEERETK